MMDETLTEMLSRHLDGDLDANEERTLAARLEAEPVLREELEAMRHIRRSVAALAAAEEVPPELDSLVGPLIEGKPDSFALRPWARWLATAAALILGVTVVIEVNRRNPGPSIESLAKLRNDGLPAEPTQRFALAPLPTSSLPVEQQPLGVSDVLLAQPAPDVALDDPAPLEVLGPLDAGEISAIEEEETTGVPPDDLRPKSSAAAPGTAAEKKGDLGTSADEASAGHARVPRRAEKDSGRDSDRGAALQSWEAAPPVGRAQLFVFIDGESAWREFAPSASCKAGRYSVRIIVGGGAVREARPVGGAASASPSQRLCAAGLILDLEIDAVPDGEYPAEIVIEPRGSTR